MAWSGVGSGNGGVEWDRGEVGWSGVGEEVQWAGGFTTVRRVAAAVTQSSCCSDRYCALHFVIFSSYISESTFSSFLCHEWKCRYDTTGKNIKCTRHAHKFFPLHTYCTHKTLYSRARTFTATPFPYIQTVGEHLYI